MNLMISHATGGMAPLSDYKRCRQALLEDAAIQSKVPRMVRTCRDPDAFWGHAKGVATGPGSYQARREYVRHEFEPLLEHLERAHLSPIDGLVEDATTLLDADSVRAAWTKAMNRRESDPEGAITAARTMMESVCKTVLDDRGIVYARKDDLPALYKAVSNALNLAPSNHTEIQFKAILGGCTTVVNNLGSIRNQASDSHGQGRKTYKPAGRHAALAVNLAGAMALFLMETHQAAP